jgi:hypothetical protein
MVECMLTFHLPLRLVNNAVSLPARSFQSVTHLRAAPPPWQIRIVLRNQREIRAMRRASGR